MSKIGTGYNKEDLSTLFSQSLHFAQISLMSLYNRYNTLLHKNSLKWAQRYRVMWVQKGDFNFAFFHNVSQIRKNKSLISHINDLDGSNYVDRKGIENYFQQFYANLWSDPNQSSFFHSLPSDLKVIDEGESTYLIRGKSKEEIYCTLMSLPSGKSLSLDSFIFYFCKFFWNDIGDHFFYYYFYTQIMEPNLCGHDSQEGQTQIGFGLQP